MQKTKIDWGVGQLYTWNPVVGCLRGCDYCYAKKINDRFKKTSFSDLQYFENRLDEPIKSEESKTVFVGSMSDIAYWKPDFLSAVLDVCHMGAPQHTFMFLTKDPVVYTRLWWPENTMQGITITGGEEEYFTRLEYLNIMADTRNPFLSIEPILGNIVTGARKACFKKIIVGAMTGAGAVKPKKEWIETVKNEFNSEKIFWKESIKPYL